jgi:hypothetical protein
MSAVEHKLPTPTEDPSVYARCRERMHSLQQGYAWVVYESAFSHEHSWGHATRGASTMRLFPSTDYQLNVDLPDSESSVELDWQMVAADLYAAILNYADAEMTRGADSKSSE